MKQVILFISFGVLMSGAVDVVAQSSPGMPTISSLKSMPANNTNIRGFQIWKDGSQASHIYECVAFVSYGDFEVVFEHVFKLSAISRQLSVRLI